MDLEFVLNGRKISLLSVEGHETLLCILRDRLGLLGTKEGCGVGECGACTILMDEKPVNACLTNAWKAHGKEILTIEGLAHEGSLHPIQQAFVDKGAIQCGFCTPGMIMSTYALLKRNPLPKNDDIKTALAGNLCRCTGYKHILEAVHSAALKMAQDSND